MESASTPSNQSKDVGQKFQDFIRSNFFPCQNEKGFSGSDPTYGRVDRDIQWKVHDMNPSSLGQRVAMENTLQNRRNNGYQT